MPDNYLDYNPNESYLQYPPDGQQNSSRNAIDNIASNISSIPITTPDINIAAKPVSFDPSQMNMERYTSDPGFDKLGYSPFRDNETLYNQNTSAWSDLGRAAKQMPTLMGAGFMTAIKSYGDILSGDIFKPDVETAKVQNDAMKIATSSRDTVGGFLTNTFLQFGSLLGVMGEVVAEGYAVTQGIALSGGKLAPFALPNLVKDVGQGIKSIGNIGSVVRDTMESLKTFNNAEDYWNLAKTIGKKANPLSNTTKYFEDLERAKQLNVLNPELNALTNFAKDASLVGSFYNDVQHANIALSMAKVAGGETKINMTNQLIDEFSSTHNGAKPEQADLDKINQITDTAAYNTVGFSTPAIFLTNKIVFNNLFKDMAPKSMFMGDVGDYINIKGEGTGLTITPKAPDLETSLKMKFDETDHLDTKLRGAYSETGENTATKTQGISTYNATESETNFNRWKENSPIAKTIIDGYNPVKEYKSWLQSSEAKEFTKGYIPEKSELFTKEFNIKHGLEYLSTAAAFVTQSEVQDIIDDSTKKYYTDLYNNNQTTWANALGNAVAGQFSSKGLDTLVNSLVTAAGIHVFSKVLGQTVKTGSDVISRYIDPIKHVDQKVNRYQESVNLANALQDVAKDPMAIFGPLVTNTGNQEAAAKGMAAAESVKDNKKFSDNQYLSNFSNISTVLKTNSADLYIKQLESIKNMDPVTLKETYNKEAPDVLEHIDKIINTINRIKNSWSNADTIFGKNPIDMSLIKKYTDKAKTIENPDYNNMALANRAFDAVKLHAVLLQDKFVHNLGRMDDLLSGLSKTKFGELNAGDFQPLTSLTLIVAEARYFEELNKGLKGETDSDTKKLVTEQTKKYELLREIHIGLKNFKETGVQSKLGESYEKYMTLLAKEQGIHVLHSDIVYSFNKFIDYHRYDDENEKSIAAINLLSNPVGFKRHLGSVYTILEGIQEQIIKKATVTPEPTSTTEPVPQPKPEEPVITKPVPETKGKIPTVLATQLLAAFEKAKVYDSTKPGDKQQQYKEWIRTSAGQAIIDKYNKDKQEAAKQTLSEAPKHTLDTVVVPEVKTNLSDLKTTNTPSKNHEVLVDALANKEEVKGKLEIQDPSALTKHTIDINGEKIEFYNHPNVKEGIVPITDSMYNKPVTFELKDKATYREKEFRPIEVFSGDKKIGLVRESDKFDNKVEPKFTEGQYVVNKSTGAVYYVVNNDKIKSVSSPDSLPIDFKNKDNYTLYDSSKGNPLFKTEVDTDYDKVKKATDAAIKDILSDPKKMADILKDAMDKATKKTLDDNLNETLDNIGCK